MTKYFHWTSSYEVRPYFSTLYFKNCSFTAVFHIDGGEWYCNPLTWECQQQLVCGHACVVLHHEAKSKNEYLACLFILSNAHPKSFVAILFFFFKLSCLHQPHTQHITVCKLFIWISSEYSMFSHNMCEIMWLMPINTFKQNVIKTFFNLQLFHSSCKCDSCDSQQQKSTVAPTVQGMTLQYLIMQRVHCILWELSHSVPALYKHT